MFARVIPLVRTPPGVEAFDYAIPTHQTVHVGDLVRIPFRHRIHVGLVTAITRHSPFADRALTVEGSYAHIHLPEALPKLVECIAKRTFSSAPSVLLSWLRTVPKRPRDQMGKQKNSNKAGLRAVWTEGPREHLLAHARKASANQRVLIITPWIILAEELRRSLPEANILHSELPNGQAFQQWTQFLSKESGCLIATKIGAWLATAADIVLLHEPEQDDHKQDESSPRYDTRRVLLWCAEQGLTEVQSYGLTPPLHAQVQAPALSGKTRTHVHHPQARSRITMLQADTLQALLDHPGPRVVIHPIPGSLSRVNCRDCHWQATCQECGRGLGADAQGTICRSCRKHFPMPGECPHCRGTDLTQSLPGIDRLKKVWQEAFPTIAVEWRESRIESLEAPLPQQALVVVTEAAWLETGEDIRKQERQCIAIRRLADRTGKADGELILQCQEAFSALVSDWLSTEGMQIFCERTRKERETFGYPPNKRVVKILLKGNEDQAEEWRKKVDTAIREIYPWKLEWRGPIPIVHQRISRTKRFVLHAVLATTVPERELIAAFTPYAKEASIDLDPIAFLR